MVPKIKDYYLFVIITVMKCVHTDIQGEMCCLKRKVSAPKRPKDSKAWYPSSFSFDTITIMGKQYKNTKNSIKTKELSEK